MISYKLIHTVTVNIVYLDSREGIIVLPLNQVKKIIHIVYLDSREDVIVLPLNQIKKLIHIDQIKNYGF